MKKIALIVVLVFVLAAFAGCAAPKNTDYMTWTSAEWQAAKDDEKLECAKAYCSELNSALGTVASDDELAAQAQDQLSAIEAYLSANADATVNDAVDAAFLAAQPAEEPSAEPSEEPVEEPSEEPVEEPAEEPVEEAPEASDEVSPSAEAGESAAPAETEEAA